MSTNKQKNWLTVGDVVYKTSGNILFEESESNSYFLAESPALEKMEEAVRFSIIENGMNLLLKKIKG